MKRILVALALFAVAFTASALDVTLGTRTQLDGAPYLETSLVYHSMSAAELTKLRSLTTDMLDAASKQQEKQGPYTVFLRELVMDGDKVVSDNESEHRGVTVHGLNQLLRVGQRVQDRLISEGEKSERAGNRQAWGKH